MEKTFRPRRDFLALEARRMAAVGLFTQGQYQAEVARRLSVSRQSVSRWHEVWHREGRRGLKGAGRAGRKPRLDTQGQKKLEQALLEGAQAWGFATHLWTLERIASVIWKVCRIHYHPRHVWRVLKAMGWSRQRPARRAKERDEQAIARWKKFQWPHIKKKPNG